MKFLILTLLLSFSALAQPIDVPDDAFAPSPAGTPKQKMSDEDFQLIKKISGTLPDFCKSKKPKDVQACNAWMRANSGFHASEPESMVGRLEHDGACVNCGLSQDIPDFCTDSKSHNKTLCAEWMRVRSSHMDESKKLPLYCQSQKQKDMEACSRWLRTYVKADNLGHCEMSADENEITCGEKIYTLSGKVSNMGRINSKIDLKDSSQSRPSFIQGKKAKQE